MHGGPLSVLCFHSDKEPLSAHSVRLWCLDQIVYLLRHVKVARSDAWIIKAVQWLVVNALFNSPSTSPTALLEPVSLPNTHLEMSIRQATLQRLMSALADVSTMSLMATISHTETGKGDEEGSSMAGGGEAGSAASGRSKRGGRQPRLLPGVMENGGYFLTAVVVFADKTKAGGTLSLVDEFSDEVMTAVCVRGVAVTHVTYALRA